MPRKKRDSSAVLGVVSALSGGISVVVFWSILPSIVFGLIGIIAGVLQVKNHRTTAAVVGLVSSVTGILFAILTLLTIIILLGRVSIFL